MDSKNLYLKLKDKDFERIWEKKKRNDIFERYYDPQDAPRFIKESVVGDIDTKMLEMQRVQELTGNDMLVGFKFAENVDTMIEFQIFMLVFFSFFYNRFRPDFHVDVKPNMTIFWMIMSEHIFSYLASYIRRQEIRRFGLPDINGVLRGRIESILSSCSLLVSCVIIGYVINLIFYMPHHEFEDNVIFYYWVFIDLMFMLTNQGFFYIGMIF